MSRVSAFFPILYFDRGYNLEYNIYVSGKGRRVKMRISMHMFFLPSQPHVLSHMAYSPTQRVSIEFLPRLAFW